MATATAVSPKLPRVFVSYSHKDEKWKDKLSVQLGVFAAEGKLEVWDDRKITAGAEWFAEIKKAIQAVSTGRGVTDLGGFSDVRLCAPRGNSALSYET
jgi:hypothetical protein